MPDLAFSGKPTFAASSPSCFHFAERQPLALLVNSYPCFEVFFSLKRNNLYEVVLKLCRTLLLLFYRSGTWLSLSESYNSLNFKILRAQTAGLTNTASAFQELLPCSNQHMGGMFLCRLNSKPSALKWTAEDSRLWVVVPKNVSISSFSLTALGL